MDVGSGVALVCVGELALRLDQLGVTLEIDAAADQIDGEPTAGGLEGLGGGHVAAARGGVPLVDPQGDRRAAPLARLARLIPQLGPRAPPLAQTRPRLPPPPPSPPLPHHP